LQADSADGGWLVLTDSYYPGWRAWIDGKPAPIDRFSDALRSVDVPAGQHTIEMRYQPSTFRVGLFISLLALALLAGLAALAVHAPSSADLSS
jgi:uncharacterized membrane protein YfhO